MSDDLRKLEVVLTSLSYRVSQLESRPAQSLPECCEAQHIAREMGYAPEMICHISMADPAARMEIIRELKRRQWSHSKIARALHLTEKTVQRATQGEG